MDAAPSHPIPLPHDSEALVALQAVAEPTRARIVRLLGHREHCVCELGEMLGLSPALVSHHLRTLRASGLLREHRSGRRVYYSLDLDRLASLRATLADLLTPGEAAATAPLRPASGSDGRSRENARDRDRARPS